VTTNQKALILVTVLSLGASNLGFTQTSSDLDNTLRDEDEEPNQQSDIEAVEPVQPKPLRDKWFFQDAELILKPRTYYLGREYDVAPERQGWALGGSLEFNSGWWQDRLRLGGTLYTSQKLYGPDDKDGTQLFKPGPESFTVLGEAYATIRLVDQHAVRVGRQAVDMPYLGKHDIRMVPNTFEAVTISSQPTTGFAYVGAYIDGIKRKNDDEFISMSEAAGAAGTDKGVSVAGARYKRSDGSLYGVVYQHSRDTFDTLFIKVEHRFGLTDDLSLWVDASYTDQDSNGDQLIGAFSTDLLSAKLELVFGPHKFRLGGSKTDDAKGIQKPYGNPANYLSVIVNDFDRAGEDGLMLGYSYSFGRIGPGDLSFFANAVFGDTPDVGPVASPDQDEYNLTVDWRLKESWSDRLWIRLRAAWIDQDEAQGGDDYFDGRVIINYDFDLLGG